MRAVLSLNTLHSNVSQTPPKLPRAESVRLQLYLIGIASMTKFSAPLAVQAGSAGQLGAALFLALGLFVACGNDTPEVPGGNSGGQSGRGNSAGKTGKGGEGAEAGE